VLFSRKLYQMYKNSQITPLSHYLRTGQKINGFRPDSYSPHDLCDLCGGTVYNLDIKSIRSERNTRYQALLQKHEAAKREGKTHKVWQMVGGPRTRQSHKNANDQIVKIDEMFRIGDEKLFLPNDPGASFSETANCRCSVKYLEKYYATVDPTSRDATAARRRRQEAQRQDRQKIEERRQLHEKNPRRHYSLNNGVILPATIKQKVSQIADRYYLATGKDILITSGRRSYLGQAIAMYNNRIDGGRFERYKAKEIIDILENIFKRGRANKKSKSEIVQEMEKVISTYAKRGIYISKHIIDGAVDVQSKFMTSAQKEAFRIAATGIATTILLETVRPHWHLQF